MSHDSSTQTPVMTPYFLQSKSPNALVCLHDLCHFNPPPPFPLSDLWLLCSSHTSLFTVPRIYQARQNLRVFALTMTSAWKADSTEAWMAAPSLLSARSLLTWHVYLRQSLALPPIHGPSSFYLPTFFL